MASSSARDLVLDQFALRQFNGRDAAYTGTRVQFDEEEFEATVNRFYEEGGRELVDGYAPFCKHIFVPNFAGVQASTLPITAENEHLLKTAYEARTEQELPVLSRHFPVDAIGDVPECKYLDIILYSREQIAKEAADMGREAPATEAPWGIISVKAQDVPYELPMQPITSMRNALGREHGGSGVPIDRDEYMRSVAFWKENAPIKR